MEYFSEVIGFERQHILALFFDLEGLQNGINALKQFVADVAYGYQSFRVRPRTWTRLCFQ